MTPDKPSDTAVGVALGVVATMLDPVTRPLFPVSGEPYFEWFIEEHSEAARAQLEAMKSAHTAPLIEFMREAAAPGAALFTALRKLFVEREVRAALDAGTEQVVVLGGGYDPLTLRLQDAYPKAVFYELDHPATQAVKRCALQKRGVVAPRLSLLPAEFIGDPVEDKLLVAGFRADASTVFVCEGVLMYLAPEKVDQMFALVRRLGGPHTRFVFTFLDRSVLANDPNARRFASMVERNGETLLSSYVPSDMEHFLRARGFRLLALGDSNTLHGEYLAPRGIDRPLRNLEFAVCAGVDTTEA